MDIYHNQRLALAGPFSESASIGLNWANSFPDWFQMIPPERVGLNGEYDHYGLKKRVEVAFRQHFAAADLAQLSVDQRGRVVILQGHIASEAALQQLVELASKAEGAIRVETGWVTVDTAANSWVAV